MSHDQVKLAIGAAAKDSGGAIVFEALINQIPFHASVQFAKNPLWIQNILFVHEDDYDEGVCQANWRSVANLIAAYNVPGNVGELTTLQGYKASYGVLFKLGENKESVLVEMSTGGRWPFHSKCSIGVFSQQFFVP